MLTPYDWVYGVAQLAAGILALIAAFICVPLFLSGKSPQLRAWRPLTMALLLFILQEIIGGLRTFGILPSTGIWLFAVHVIVSGILALMIVALIIQLQVNRGWLR